MAVDAGGTKSIACLAQVDGRSAPTILGRGRAAAGNPLSVPFEQAMRAIDEAIRLAHQQADLPAAPVARAVLSIAGAASDEMRSRVIAWGHASQLAEKIAIVTDILPVLAAGTSEGVGVAIVSGTGSVAVGRAPDGHPVRVGGWGYLLGDEGSGYAIGRAGLRLVLEDLETKAELRPLAARLVKEFSASSVSELTGAIYGCPNPRTTIAALAPYVLAAAETGDPDALEIVTWAARKLAALTQRAVRSANLGSEGLAIALGGSLLVGSPRLQNQLQIELRNLSIASATTVVHDPLIGCLRLATPDFAPGLIEWH